VVFELQQAAARALMMPAGLNSSRAIKAADDSRIGFEDVLGVDDGLARGDVAPNPEPLSPSRDRQIVSTCRRGCGPA